MDRNFNQGRGRPGQPMHGMRGGPGRGPMEEPGHPMHGMRGGLPGGPGNDLMEKDSLNYLELYMELEHQDHQKN